MLIKIVVAIVAVIAVLAIFIASRPASFRVARSATIAAPPEVIFAMVNDLHQFERWSPFEKLDPKMAKDYSGAPAGVGSSLHWVGNSKAGEGRMTITESKPLEHVAMRLEFLKPMQATNTADLTLKPGAGGVEVTWAMSGNAGFMQKAFMTFMDMDKMVGKDFAEGLGNLKRISEEQARSAGR